MRLAPILMYCLGLAQPAPAQEGPLTLDVGAVLRLGLDPWQGRAEFAQSLALLLPSFRADANGLGASGILNDPFLWVLSGHFAAPPVAGVPGGILSCARYGLATRDWLAEHPLSDPETFALYRLILPSPDDAQVWPDAAIARLGCTLTWDDERAVAIIPAEVAWLGLREHFDSVTRSGSGEALYGSAGYRLDAGEGQEDSMRVLESARIVLTVRHQTLSFRAFLMNGGM